MTTVQLAITDAGYLRNVRSLLLEDGEHHAVVVDIPSSKIPGIIAVESDILGNPAGIPDPSRYVVITSRKAYFRTSQLWQAGFRRVVFADEPPIVTYLAILATEQSLTAGLTSEATNRSGLQGPFELTDARIDAEVRMVSPGVYLLGSVPASRIFEARYAGRANDDLNNQLHVYVGNYSDFEYEYCPSAQAAFEGQCKYFHTLNPYDNAMHPRRTPGSLWQCPRCGE